jgi:hypothetical protein
MSADVISFPRARLRPNAIQVQFDFGKWSLAYFQDRRLTSRLDFSSKEAAEDEARRLVESGGFTWRMGENGTVYIMTDASNGGGWCVAHHSRSGDSDGIIGWHLALDSAISHAIKTARKLGAEFTISGKSNDTGGAA